MSKQMTGSTPVWSVLSLVFAALTLSGCMGESTPYTPADGSNPNNAAPSVSTDGYWDAPFTLATQSAASSSSPTIIKQHLSIADNGNAFVSYALTSSSGAEEMKVLRAVAPGYSWSSASDPMMTPVDIKLSAATMTQFAVNPNNADGYALWNNGTSLQISEFMNGMGHFMTRASVGEGHVPQVRVNQAGAAFLVTQDHMSNGFAVNVTRRLGVGSWSSPVSLERMGQNAANEILLPNHLLLGSVDGQGDILALWIEQQGGEYRLMTATYDTENNTWGSASTIVDSNNTHGLDLAATKSFGVAEEPGTNKVHVALFTDDGSAKAVFKIDFDGSAWQMPMRADVQTASSTISSNVRYAFADGRMVVAWVETSGTMQMIKALRFDAATGWSSVADVAMAAMGATVSDLTLAVNDQGHSIATWVETGAAGTTIQASLQKAGAAWAAKELVLTATAGDMLTTPSVAMHSDGTPWIVVSTGRDDATNVNFTTALIRRAANIDDVGGAAPGAGTGDGHDHDHGGGTTTPGTGTGTGTDTGSGSSPVVEPGADFVSGYWNASTMVASDTQANSANPAITQRRLEITEDGTLFMSWSSVAGGVESIKVMRAKPDSSGAYVWSDPASTMYVPLGITQTATMTQFTANHVNADGYALWEDGSMLKLSEFMGGMGHFMNTADVGEGHEPRILVDSSGMAYLFKQSHMTNGFGLDVSNRVAMGNWSAPVQLHRMGMNAANAINMPNHFFTAAVDGQDNIAAVWLETQAGVTRLNAATFNTTGKTWGNVATIIDSGHSHGVDLASLKSLALVGQANTANLHLLVYENTGSVKTVHSIDFTNGAWGEPVRRDMDMGGMAMIMGEPKYASNAEGQLVAAWVESHMNETHIQALRFNGTAWIALETAAMPGAGATIDNLGVSVNHHGDAQVTWTESDSAGLRVLAALRPADGSWAQKELVEEAIAGTTVSSLVGVLSHDGMPWVAWTMDMTMGTNTMAMSHVSMRHDSISTTTPPNSGTDPGTGGGTTDPGTGTGGGTTDPGTGTGGGTTDPGTGTGGGTTDPGTGGGTTDPGTGTGGGTTDPGTGTGGGMTDPGTGAATGLWGTQTVISTATKPVADEALTRAPGIRVANNGNVFLSWLTQSGHSQDPAHVEQDITIVRGVPASAGGYTWSDPGSAMMKPTGFDAHAVGAKFVVNPVTGDGFANWRDATTTYVSEFMGMMGHFMTNVTFAASDASQVLVDATGKVYLLTKDPMMGGFGLSVYTRAGFDSWSSAVQLHRMDMANAFSMPNNFMIAAVDGLNNIRVIWLEDHAGAMTLQTATFNTSSSTWSTVSEVHAHGMTLNRVVSGIASGKPGTADLELVLHEQDGMGMNRAIFSISYDETGAWAEPMRLDMASADVTVMSSPAFARNSNGALLIAWVETNAAMTANNSSGLMHMIMGKTYTPAGGWSSMVHIASAAMNADASAVTVAVGASGDMSATWLESAGGAGQLFASHKIPANTMWSQKESVITLSNGDGSVQSHAVGLNNANLPLVLLATRTTDGVNDSLQVGRIARLSAIDNAAPGSGGMDPGNGGTTDPGTGGGSTDPGTGTGGGSGGDVDPGTPLPPSAVWTTPLMVSQMMHSATSTRFFGPEVVRDDVGGTAIKMSMEDINLGEGAAIAAVHNHIVRSADGSEWGSIVMNSGLLAGLTSSAIVHNIDVVTSTGNLYGLIRDGDKLYLARYLVNVGWSKIEVPDVHSSIVYSGLQLASNQSGMVTLSWYELAPQCCDIHIHAKHYMASGGWQETETLTVPAEAMLDTHVVENDGTVHAAWMVTNPDSAVGGYNLKMAVYTPMQGWSAQMDGPTGLANSLAVTGGSGNQQLVVVTDPVSGHIDAYIINGDGSWSKHENINQKATNDGVQVINARDVEVIAGGNANFMVVWREHVSSSNQMRYRSASVSKMTNPSTNMDMWHWNDPSVVAGTSEEVQRNIHFSMDSMGNAYAAWTSVDTATDHSHVYVNLAAMTGVWGTPEMLAEYDLTVGASARNTSIAINALNQVSIAWDQHMVTSTSSMHHVWVVEKQ